MSSRQPRGLGAAGRALWRSFTAPTTRADGSTAVLEFDTREAANLAQAARIADTIADLEAVLAVDGVVVLGSKGQPRLHPAVAELRAHRLALSRLLGELAIPDADEKPVTARSERATRAADARWDRQRRIANGA